jgi:hypothetical protein
MSVGCEFPSTKKRRGYVQIRERRQLPNRRWYLALKLIDMKGHWNIAMNSKDFGRGRTIFIPMNEPCQLSNRRWYRSVKAIAAQVSM